MEDYAERVKNVLVKVLACKAETLLAAICDSFEEESIIYFDYWKAYKMDGLDDTGFRHYKVNYRFNFLGPETDVHTND